MATYGSSTDLGYLINAINSSVSSDLKSYSLEVADTWINGALGSINGTTPDLIEKAATYYAYSFLIRNLNDTYEGEQPMADWFQKQAEELLDSYMSQHPGITEYESPYSSRLTPTRVFSKRNLRTVTDNDDVDNIDDTGWESE